ncbi:hypothetical protein PRIPAC_76238, partial [Pristionchus pacificus]|uniref:G protein-coupled receptor n=1 Tax=Pristionchus pacificus TaxID=54126 RepID=A0A2A6C802_PRIPA
RFSMVVIIVVNFILLQLTPCSRAATELQGTIFLNLGYPTFTMQCMRPVAPSIHNALRICKLFLTFSSMLMACLCVFIIRKTPSISKEYARLMLMLIYITAQLDVYTQLIFDPQYIMPALCIFRDAPLINIPLNPAWGFVIWVTFMALNAPIYAACFCHRHQLIVPEGSIFKLRKYSRTVCIIIVAAPSLTYGYSYYLAWIPTSHPIMQKYFSQHDISTEWDPASIASMECFQDYQLLRNAWAFVIFICGLIFFAFIPAHTFAILRRARNLSAKTRKYHRIMMTSLIVVGTIPILLIVIPFATAMVYYTLLESDELPLMEISSFLFAFHSIVHSTTLILTTPVFRARLLKMLHLESAYSSVAAVSRSSINFFTNASNL